MWDLSDGENLNNIAIDDISLENFLSPFSYGEETPLPTLQSGEGGIHLQNSKGFISQDCQWGCSYSRNVIRCFPVDAHRTSGQYVSRGSVPVVISVSSYHFPSANITCATELAIHNQKTMLGIRKVLIGLKVRENDALRGAVVIFDPIRSLPMKWISLPFPVSSVSVISHYEEGGFTRPLFNEAMMAMVGVAAVGMEGGDVLIIDLGLDDPNLNNCDNVPGGLTPRICRYSVTPVDPHELLIAMKRHNLVTKKKLICIDLVGEHDEELEPENNYYLYCCPNKSVLLALEKKSVCVTSLEYIPAIGSLIVGYSFGSFQIWKMDNANLIFSSPVQSPEIATEIFGFTFQQPVDDPKSFCYLWVLYGKSTFEMHYSHAELYGLLYNEKRLDENMGYNYNDLQQCVKRLTLRLEDYFDNATDSDDSTGDRSYLSAKYCVRPIRIWSLSDTLTFFSWESNRNGIYYVGVFDLNQWYSDHTPDRVRYSATGLCPYWVAIPVETLDRFASVWDVSIVPKSIERWENPHAKLDLHFYPASITFRGVCLSNSGTSTFEFFGIQEKLLRILQRNGPDIMVEPGQFKNLCHTYGLQPVCPHNYEDLSSEQEADRYFILSVLLESRRSALIFQMADKWIDGAYSNVGCSVDLILDWIFTFTYAIRESAGPHWDDILNFQNEIVSPGTAHFINYSNFIWHALLGVLNTLMRPDQVYESRSEDLEDLKFGLEKLVQYSAALLMFYKAGILPEGDDHDFTHAMSEYYEQRRIDVKGALQNCDFLDPEFKSGHALLIDYLLENFDQNSLREHWQLESDESPYPPKHIGYILNMFLWAHEDPKAIFRVIAYYLIDLSSLLSESVKLRGDFASIIQLSTEEQTEIYNMWALDHVSCHEVLLFLSQKERLHESDGLPWCAAVVILTALGHGESIAELLQKYCPTKLGRLYFNLMTTSSAKYGFLMDDICSSASSIDFNHLRNFFEVSDKHNLLGEFVKAKSFSAPPGITNALVEYLQSHNNFENCDRLLSYYIHREEWDKLREQFSCMKLKSIAWRLTNHQKSIWNIRQRLVESLLKPVRVNIPRFISDGDESSQTVYPYGPPRKIKTYKIKHQTTLPSHLESRLASYDAFNNIVLPPMLPKFNTSITKSSDPVTPSKSKVGNLSSVIGTPSSGPDTPNSSGPLNQRKSFCRNIRRSFSMGGARSPVSLAVLLKTPAVENRQSMTRSVLFEKDTGATLNDCDNSSYFTPSGNKVPRDSPVHSIMKKQDSLREYIGKKGLRFLERETSTEENSQLFLPTDPDQNNLSLNQNILVETNAEVYGQQESNDTSVHNLPAEKDVILDASFLGAENISIETNAELNVPQESNDAFINIMPTASNEKDEIVDVDVDPLNQNVSIETNTETNAPQENPATLVNKLPVSSNGQDEILDADADSLNQNISMEMDTSVSIQPEVSAPQENPATFVNKLPVSSNEEDEISDADADSLNQNISMETDSEVNAPQESNDTFVKKVPSESNEKIVISDSEPLNQNISIEIDTEVNVPQERNDTFVNILPPESNDKVEILHAEPLNQNILMETNTEFNAPQESNNDTSVTKLPVASNEKDEILTADADQLNQNLLMETITENNSPQETNDTFVNILPPASNENDDILAADADKLNHGISIETNTEFNAPQESNNDTSVTKLPVASSEKDEISDADADPLNQNILMEITENNSPQERNDTCLNIVPPVSNENDDILDTDADQLNQNISIETNTEVTAPQESNDTSLHELPAISNEKEEILDADANQLIQNILIETNTEVNAKESNGTSTNKLPETPNEKGGILYADEDKLNQNISIETNTEVSAHHESKDAFVHNLPPASNEKDESLDASFLDADSDPLNQNISIETGNDISTEVSNCFVKPGNESELDIFATPDASIDEINCSTDDRDVKSTSNNLSELTAGALIKTKVETYEVSFWQSPKFNNKVETERGDSVDEAMLSINASQSLLFEDKTEEENKSAKEELTQIKPKRTSKKKSPSPASEHGQTQEEKPKKNSTRRRKTPDRSIVMESSTSVIPASDSESMNFPRRLTRNQKAMLENTMVDINEMGEASMQTPKHSPVKGSKETGFEFTPPMEKTCDTKGKSVDGDSNTSSERSFASSAASQDGRNMRGPARRSKTPESEKSFRSTSELSERRMTRSQGKRESQTDNDQSDVSMSGSEASIFEATLDESPKSSVSQRRNLRTRSRSKTPSILPVVQEDSELDIAQTAKKTTRKAAKERKKPVKENDETSTDVNTPGTKRKRQQRKVFNFSPEVSTIIEERTVSAAEASVLEATLPNTSDRSPKKSRAVKAPKSSTSSISSIVEENLKPSKRRKKSDIIDIDDDARSDISISSSVSNRSTSSRKSVGGSSLPRRVTRSSKK